jgi:hypothetical protein
MNIFKISRRKKISQINLNQKNIKICVAWLGDHKTSYNYLNIFILGLTCGLHYKHTTNKNDASRVVSE